MALPLICLGTVDSTQAFLKRNPHLGFCGVLAETQTTGRGQRDRSWSSPRGEGLWLSAALPVPKGLAPGLVPQRAMAAVGRLLDPEGRVLGLKWPNDLVAWAGSRLQKVGGILGEQDGRRLILGLGVNLLSAPLLQEPALPAGCLRDLGLTVPATRDLAGSLLEAWQDLPAATFEGFRWPVEGEAIRWAEGQGTCLGWEADGRLKVRTEAGICRLTSGDLQRLR